MKNEGLHSNGLCFSPLYKGAEVLENGDVLFSLFAPEAESVQVAGLGSDTGFGTNVYSLEKQEDGNWTVRVSGIRPGLHYYRYIVDGFEAVVGTCPV